MENDELQSAKDSSHPLHPAVVHFPISLFPLSLLFLVIWFWSGKAPFYLHAAYWSLLLGALFSLPAGFTGFRDFQQTTIEQDPIHGVKVAKAHIRLGISIITLSVLGGLYFLINPPMFHPALIGWFIALSLALSIMVSIQGFLGGLLVYSYHTGLHKVPK